MLADAHQMTNARSRDQPSSPEPVLELPQDPRALFRNRREPGELPLSVGHCVLNVSHCMLPAHLEGRFLRVNTRCKTPHDCGAAERLQQHSAGCTLWGYRAWSHAYVYRTPLHVALRKKKKKKLWQHR